MSIDYAQLEVEITTDPATIGYATLLADGNHDGVAGLLNQVRAGTSITKTYVPIEDVLAAIVLTEFNALAAAGKTACDMFLRGTRIKSGSANLRTTLAALFAVGTTTRNNLVALATRDGSRGELLFGEGTNITAADVARALQEG